MGYRRRTLRAPTINDDLWNFIARDTPWPDRCFTQFVVTQLEVRAIWNEHRDHILNYWVITNPGTRPHHWWMFDAPRLQLDVESQARLSPRSNRKKLMVPRPSDPTRRTEWTPIRMPQ